MEPEVPLPRQYIDGLQNVKWPGRCQTIPDPNQNGTTWFLDGAHTIESLDCCIRWFVSPGVGLAFDNSKRPIRVLIFNITHGRSGTSFLGAMLATVAAQLKLHGQAEDSHMFFDHVVFCTNATYANGGSKGDLIAVSTPESELTQLNTQKELAFAWSELNPSFPTSRIHILPSIEHAVNCVRSLESESHDPDIYILVTGSLHLVGGLIEAASLSDAAL
jgi:folylpolyglutamate synthase